MTAKVTSTAALPATASAAVNRICDAIINNDMAGFDAVLSLIDDLDGENNRILRTCIDHDRFAMAKKLFVRGAASTILLGQLKNATERAHRAYMDAPSSDDRTELKKYHDIKRVYERLDAWKTTFEKDILPALSMQKMQELQDQIAALRQEITDMITPARNVVKKPPAPTR